MITIKIQKFFMCLLLFVFYNSSLKAVDEQSEVCIKNFLLSWPSDEDPKNWDSFFQRYVTYVESIDTTTPQLSLFSYPSSMVVVMCNAQEAAKELLNTKLPLREILKKITETVVALEYRDPYMVFSLVKEIFQQSKSRYSTKDAFTFSARLVMDAPFFIDTANKNKRNSGSFRYFSECANYMSCFQQWADITVSGSDKAFMNDFWQMYFNEQAYADCVPWLESLYHFYIKEAEWIKQQKQPVSESEWNRIKDKITKQDEFDNVELINSKTTNHETVKNFIISTGQFLSIDKTIYWRLFHLFENSPYKQEFFNLMAEQHGQDFLPVIDKNGTIPGRQTLVKNAASRIDTAPPATTQDNPPLPKPNTKKRPPLKDITNAKCQKTKTPNKIHHCINQQKRNLGDAATLLSDEVLGDF